MRLIRKLEEFKKFPSGKQRIGEFECSYCLKIVTKTVAHGRRDHSCGCERNKGELNGRMDHGLCAHPLYAVLSSIKQRCSNPNCKDYPRYGGRGISVCSEWNDVKVFIEWALANGWRKGLTIDRKDNDGNYTPDNCRFRTSQLNSQNSSRSKITLEIATAIKRRLATENCPAIAGSMGVGLATVRDISRGRSWRNAI